MDWKNNVNLLFDPLRELASNGSDTAIRDVTNEGVPELTENNVDNWNGGTTHYTLWIDVPPHLFVQIEDQLEKVEQKILKRVEQLQRAETHDSWTP